MASKVIYERFLWFHGQVSAGRYPNAGTLAGRFEVSRKTAQRDIEFMRDRLGAPLAYEANRRGYRNDGAYELPGLWLDEEELTALLVSYRVASLVPDSALKGSLRSFLNQALTLLGSAGTVSLEDLNDKVSVKNIGYSRTSGRTFHRVLDSLVKGRAMRLEYSSPHTGETTSREVFPLHLLHYMGTWHLIGHCGLRGGLRYFTLSRIAGIGPSGYRPDTRIPQGSIKDYIRKNFGILAGEERYEVCLRFSKDASPWVAEQVWHPGQEAEHRDDGTLCLKFLVADLREVKREVLRHGAEVEVLEPEELREAVKAEIARMRGVYG